MGETPSAITSRPLRSQRCDYHVFRLIPTRWADNDAYGHVNNIVYYEWFDTAVNAWLIETGSLVLGISPIIGLVVETGCSYFESVSFPQNVEIGMAVKALGLSSVTYEIGVFSQGGNLAIAQGRFTHVYVDQASQAPVPIPDDIRARMEAIARPV